MVKDKQHGAVSKGEARGPDAGKHELRVYAAEDQSAAIRRAA
jgi:hypothetical protein